MGGGLASFLPNCVKQPFWNGMARIRNFLGTDSASKTAKSTSSKGRSGTVGESSDSLVDDTIKNFRELLKSNPELARKIFKQNGSGLTREQLAKVREALPDLITPQGVKISKTPNLPNARELGLPQPIADATLPKTPKPSKSSNADSVTPQAYHGHYENSGDPDVTGIAPDDVRLRANMEAQRAGVIPMSEHKENLRIVLGDEEEVQNAIDENSDQYNQVPKWLRDD